MRARWLAAPLLLAGLAGCPAFESDNFIIGDASTESSTSSGSSSGGSTDATMQESSAADGTMVGEEPQPSEEGGMRQGPDAGADAGADASVDAGVDAGGCGPLDTVLNCGACGASCDMTYSQGASCGVNGAGVTTCMYTGCNAGYADCVTAAPDTNGCETPLNTIVNCGACGAACAIANSSGESCSANDAGVMTCTYTCAAGYGDCDSTPPNTNGCETPLNTTSNCSACSAACDTTTGHSTGATCSGGTCVYTGCASGWADCNTTPPDVNGCDTPVTGATCSACGSSCDTTHSLGGSCSGGTCTYTGCESGYADCNTTPPNVNGCSTSLSSIDSCGGCGNACDTTHSQGASCSANVADVLTCMYTGCNAGYADCDTAAPDTNGCESSLSSPTTCGSCGNVCPVPANGAATCTGATCGILCNAGYNTCGSSCLSADSTASCGGCSNVCSTATGTPSCNGSSCSYACDSNRQDCNYATAPDTDGCECVGTGCCGSGCQTPHASGIPSPATYYDCSATGNSTEADAMNACTGVGASGCANSSTSCGCVLVVCSGSAASVCGTLNGTCYCWQYSGVNPGKVQSSTSGSCAASCGSSSNPSWD